MIYADEMIYCTALLFATVERQPNVMQLRTAITGMTAVYSMSERQVEHISTSMSFSATLFRNLRLLYRNKFET